MFLTLAEDPEVGIINDDVAFAVSVDVDGQSRAYVLTFKGRVQNRLTAFQLRQKVGAADRFGDFFYLDLIYSILVFYLFSTVVILGVKNSLALPYFLSSKP